MLVSVRKYLTDAKAIVIRRSRQNIKIIDAWSTKLIFLMQLDYAPHYFIFIINVNASQHLLVFSALFQINHKV